RFVSYDALLDVLAEVAPDRTRPAGLVARGLALLFDLIVVGAVAAVLASGIEALGGRRIDMFPILAALYGIFLPARIGATLGKKLLEIELTVDGRRGGIGVRRAAKRFVLEWGPIYVLAYLAIFIGMWLPQNSSAKEAIGAIAGILGAGIPLVSAVRS